MSKFLKNSHQWALVPDGAMNLHDELPVGTYVMKTQPITDALYLEQMEDFQLPKKVYGKVKRYADRIMNTFVDRPRSTGVLLSGEKGGGKTLLAKMISIDAAAAGIPTIVINIPVADDRLSQFMQAMKQPAVVLMDEFEKVFDDKEKQVGILTLLDGVFNTRKLFLLTCNDKWGIDQHMHNRPGRLFYSIEFKGMDYDAVEEYCKDRLEDQQYTPKVCELLNVFSTLNFDMLQAIVEEMNRYKESPLQVLEMLNVQMEKEEYTQFDVKVLVDGKEIPAEEIRSSNPVCGSPMDPDDDHGSRHLVLFGRRVDDEGNPLPGNPIPRQNIVFAMSDLLKMDPKTGSFVFQQKNIVAIYTRKKTATFSYHKYLT